MKKESIKILIWVSITFIVVVVYKITVSIIFSDWNEFLNFFKNTLEYPEQLIIYFIPYIIFRLFSILFYFIGKFSNSRINYNKISKLIVIAVISLIFIKLIAEEFIIKSYLKNKSSYFVVNKKISNVNPSNFKEYTWSRKIFEPEGISLVNDSLYFKDDTTIVIKRASFSTDSNLLTSDLFFRYLFNKYSDTSKDEYLFKDSIMIGVNNKFKLKFNNGKLESNFY